MKSTKSIFVYGTLQENERNFKYFEDTVLSIKRGFINANLYYLPEYNCPAIVKGENKIYGELITFKDPSNKIEKQIDDLESNFSNGEKAVEYIRLATEVFVDEEIYQASAYFLSSLDSVKHQIIEHNWHDLQQIKE